MSVTDSPSTTSSRPSSALRRTGYVVAVLVNAVILVLVNVRPGWDVLPFLTADTTRVLPLVNASIAAGVIANSMYLLADPPALRSLGDVVVTTVGLVALVALWRVFPLAFPGQTFGWAVLARVLLLLGMVGSVISIAVGLVTLVHRGVTRP